jgi:hypothetical protein
MKRKNYYIVSFIAFILTLALVITVTAVKVKSSEENEIASTTISEAYIPSETTTVKETTTKESTTEKVITTTREPSTEKETTSPSVKVETTTTKVETTEAEDHPATTEPTTKQTLKDSNWEAKAKQYPVATEIWLYMKDLGWSDAVCAGIMGNIMAEVGGQTLNINPYLSSSSYYGMCQWSKRYYPQIIGGSLEAQCNFLRDTIQKEINTYGSNYASGMNYSRFLQLTSPADVALCFAKSYERCASGSYGVRQSNAQKAYDYFVG